MTEPLPAQARDSVAETLRVLSFILLVGSLLVGLVMLMLVVFSDTPGGCPTMACVGEGLIRIFTGPAIVFVGSVVGGLFNALALLLQSRPRTFQRKREAALIFLPALMVVIGSTIYLKS